MAAQKLLEGKPDETTRDAVRFLEERLKELRDRFASEGGQLDLTKIHVGPDNTISWEDAKTIILKGDVTDVSQTHALDVWIRLKDGTSYRTREPKIDMVSAWLEKCGKKKQGVFVTE